MKTPGVLPSLLCTLVLVAGGWLIPTHARAQTRTASGNFTGDYHGSFVRTLTITASGSTVQTVYTRHGDRATRTDIATTTTMDNQGDYTLVESHLDFGATVPDTSQAVYTQVEPGQHTATGTYTTATGDSGTLTAVLARTASGTSRSELHVSATTGNTLILRVEHEGSGSAGCKVLTLGPGGTLTSSSLVRYAEGPAVTPTPAPTATPTVTPTPTPMPTVTPTPTPAAPPQPPPNLG